MVRAYLLVLLFFTLVLSSNVSAIRINEIEINPAGADTGNEWIELYSNEEIDLSDYKIRNNDGQELALEGSFDDYYVINLEKQWLDNSDEKVFLYKGSELIDETEILEDAKNNDMTWQYCGSWTFMKETKEEGNGCDGGNNEDDNVDKNKDDNTTKNDSLLKKVNEIINNKTSNENIKETEVEELKPVSQTIKLTSKTIKSQDSSEEESKNRFWIYGIIGLCLLVAILFWLKRRKNELE